MPPKRKAAEPPPPPDGLFAGKRLAFFAPPADLRRMRAIVVQRHSATLVDEVEPGVHAVSKMSLAEAQPRLEALAARGLPGRRAAGLFLPDGVEFVTADWVAACITAGGLQPEAAHRPAFYETIRAALDAADTAAAAAAAAVAAAAQQQQAADEAAAAAEADGSGSTEPFTAEELEAARRGVDVGAAAAAAAAAAEPSRPLPPADPGAPLVVERRGADFVAVSGALPRFTGGATGLPWGTAGVWAEPFDAAAAAATRDKLRAFWQGQAAGGAGGAGGSGTPGGAPPRAAGACGHAACGARDFCIVERLADAAAAYSLSGRGKRTDQFKRKALEVAKARVAAWPRPLDAPADVDALALGDKSAAKVVEILATGTTARAEAAARDARLAALRELETVWGVGPEAAEAFYAAGVRSVAELAARALGGDAGAGAGAGAGPSAGAPPLPRLTEQQRAGLRHYADIAARIPRWEVAAAERAVREEVLAEAEAAGAGAAGDADRTYCFATGSFIRGAPDSGDIDMLVVLPPSLEGADCVAFLRAALGRLLRRGLLLDELSPRDASSPHKEDRGKGGRASWMGLCRPPGGEGRARRIDVKVYAHRYLPFAVNYFANSEGFARATRHWANYAVPEVAASLCPGASGFKVSDREIMPIAVEGGKARGAAKVQVGAAVAGVRCETDIFALLGLDNVPPTMRFFGEGFK